MLTILARFTTGANDVLLLSSMEDLGQFPALWWFQKDCLMTIIEEGQKRPGTRIDYSLGLIEQDSPCLATSAFAGRRYASRGMGHA